MKKPKTTTSSSQNKTCGVCHGSLASQATFTAACSHSFHFSCINTSNHFSYGIPLPRCPLCQPIPNNTNVFKNHSIYNAPSSQKRKGKKIHNASVFGSRPYGQTEPHQFSDDDPLLSDPSSSTVGLQKVTITAIPEREALAYSESLSQFTVLIRLKAPSLPSSQQRAPLDLVTVLDVSGSMQGEKLALVKRAVHFVIDELGPSDRLSIVSFSDEARRIFRLSRMTEAGRKAAKLAVDSLVVVGGTNIVEGLKKGARVLVERRYKNPVASIIFLSDGNDSYNPRSTSKQAIPQYLRRLPPLIYPGSGGGQQQEIETIPVHSFGFGSDHDPVKMHAISDASGGTFSYIQSYEMVQGAFASCIGGLLSVVTQELRLALRSASDGVVMKSIPSGRYKSEIVDQGSKGLINVGDRAGPRARRERPPPWASEKPKLLGASKF